MSTELIINAKSPQVNIALTEEGRLTEYHTEDNQNEFGVGDLYLGKVRKLIPGLNAAFIDIGHEKDAFLHYQDLGPQVKSLLNFVKQMQSGSKKNSSLFDFPFDKNIEKQGKIGQILTTGMPVVVQITKEAISTKGPRLSSEISFPGRFIVLVPFNDKVSISQKIKKKEERDRLKFMLGGMCPKGFGVIARTNSVNCKAEELTADLDALLKKWELTAAKIKQVKAPAKVLSETNKVTGIIRDMFNDTFSSVIVDDESLFLEVSDYVESIAPGRSKIVRLHSDKVPVFEKYGVDRQVKTSFGRTVPMSKGAYLVIEHTEALHVIDVNSGNRLSSKESQETNSVEVNLIAAKEIARQLRLRDMGGIIVVDFIDMQSSENRKILTDKLTEFMRGDRAKHKILPPSKFGLIQITRQRVRPETEIKTSEPDPNGGSGDVIAPIHILDEIREAIEQVKSSTDYKGISLHTHPFVAAYLTKGFPSLRTKWFFRYGRWIKIIPRDAFQFLQYRFYDNRGKMIKL